MTTLETLELCSRSTSFEAPSTHAKTKSLRQKAKCSHIANRILAFHTIQRDRIAQSHSPCLVASPYNMLTIALPRSTKDTLAMHISKILLLCVGPALALRSPPLSSSEFDRFKIDYSFLAEGFRSAVSAGLRPGYDEASYQRSMSSFRETVMQTTKTKHLNSTSQTPDSDTFPKPIVTVVTTTMSTVLTLTRHGVFSSDLATASQVDTRISAQATSRLAHATAVTTDSPTTFDTVVVPTRAVHSNHDTASQAATKDSLQDHQPKPIVPTPDHDGIASVVKSAIAEAVSKYFATANPVSINPPRPSRLGSP